MAAAQSLKNILRTILIGLGIAFVSLILIQDFLVMPGAFITYGKRGTPSDVISGFVQTEDEERIHYWRLDATEPNGLVAVISHGNAGNVGSFFAIQRWLQGLGISSYGFDYRGFDKSSGWPSEEGTYLDTKAVINRAMQEQGITNDRLVLVGVSIGTGPATRLALDVKAQALVLFSPFKSVPAITSQNAVYWPFSKFLWYDYPSAKIAPELKTPCTITVYGLNDGLIPPEQSARIHELLKPHTDAHEIISADSGHGDLFHNTKAEVGLTLLDCLSKQNIDIPASP